MNKEDLKVVVINGKAQLYPNSFFAQLFFKDHPDLVTTVIDEITARYDDNVIVDRRVADEIKELFIAKIDKSVRIY